MAAAEPANQAGTMHVPLHHVAATIRALRRVASVVPLRDLVSRHLEGRSTRGHVAITLDDAYVSVLSAALPIIEREATLVTLLVVLDRAQSGEPHWWDRIDAVLGSASPGRWRSFENECGLSDRFPRAQPAHMGRHWPLRQWILGRYRRRWPDALEQPLRRLEQEVGSWPTQRPMTFAELDSLARSPLVDLGPHTLSHPTLPLLPDNELRREIRQSFDELRGR